MVAEAGRAGRPASPWRSSIEARRRPGLRAAPGGRPARPAADHPRRRRLADRRGSLVRPDPQAGRRRGLPAVPRFLRHRSGRARRGGRRPRGISFWPGTPRELRLIGLRASPGQSLLGLFAKHEGLASDRDGRAEGTRTCIHVARPGSTACRRQRLGSAHVDPPGAPADDRLPVSSLYAVEAFIRIPGPPSVVAAVGRSLSPGRDPRFAASAQD